MPNLELVSPSKKYQAAFIAMARDFQTHGENRYDSVLPKLETSFDLYLQRLEMQAKGIGLREGIVPQTTLWSVLGEEVIGVIRIRHRLTPHLEQVGGHIGYQIRPGWRRRGLGTRQLALALVVVGEWGWKRVLITCDDDNIGSARIIEANGGALWDVINVPGEPKPIRRYWVRLG